MFVDSRFYLLVKLYKLDIQETFTSLAENWQCSNIKFIYKDSFDNQFKIIIF